MKTVLPNKIKLLIVSLLISLFLSIPVIYPGRVQAATSCTASVSPSSIAANSTRNVFTFSVTNTGDTAVTFVTIRRPSADFTLNNIGVAGWTVGATSELAFLSDGNIDPGSSTDFIFHVNAGPNEAASANWSISVGPGGNETSCTGSLGTAISGSVDTSPPVISSISVLDITSSSASINWTTDEDSDSTVGYDADSSYATEVRTSNATLTTSHSIALSSLTADTTYYYYVESTDGSGNTNSEEGGTFTTPSTDAPTPTPRIVTATVTETITVTSTSTPRSIRRLSSSLTKRSAGSSQLFDISLELDDTTIFDIANLVARVIFISFGNEPTPVDLTFTILDQEGEEQYQVKTYTTVETETVVTQTFRSAEIDLAEGEYTLLLRTLYNTDVEDEFRVEFAIERKIFGWKFFLFALPVVLGVSGIVFSLRKKKRGEL